MKDKIILFFVRRHAGEIDWILPLLSKYKKQHKIITIFANQSSYESLKNNSDIFKIWKSICKNYLIITNKNKFFWKILNKILILLKNLFNNKIQVLNNFQNYVLENTFDLNNFLKIFKIKLIDIKVLFLPIVDQSYISKIFKLKNSKILIVRFPESTMITANKKENPNIVTSMFSNVTGDVFVFSSKSNKEYFLGDNNLYNSKIIYSGFLRYEKWWINKFLTKKKKTNIFKILVAIRGPNEFYYQKSSYIKTIKDIMEIVKNIKNCKAIFKVHPQDKDIYLLKDILSKFNKNFWSISSNHILKLSQNSDFCISILTSACFDCLSIKKPTVEYYDVEREISLSKNAINHNHMIFDKRKKKWITIFNYKNLLKTFDNKENLQEIIYQVFNGKKNNLWEKNFNEFQKLIKNKIDAARLFEEINKYQKQLN